MPRCSIVVAGLLACMWHAAPFVFAQGYPTELVGTVRDDGGRPARGVPVVVEDERGVARATVKTDPQGFYLVSGLMPGCYLVTIADYPQFTPQRRVAIIAQNFATTVNVTLEMRLAEVQQVTVDIDALLGSLGTWDSSVGLRFTRQAIESSPLTHGRNLQSFLDTVPGIVFSESRANGAQFTAVGQRRFSNRLTIDQMNADLGMAFGAPDLGSISAALPAVATSGGTQTLVPLAAIDEVQVRITNSTSEHARTPGAQVSIITRSGGETFHGDASFQTRPNRLGASSWIANAGPQYFGLETAGTQRPLFYRNATASIGGPVWPRKVRIFAAWERQSIERPVFTTIDTPSVSLRASAAGAFRAVLDAFPQPNSAETGNQLTTLTDTIPNPSGLSVLSVRFDGQIGAGHSAFLRANRGSSSGAFWDAVNRLPFASTNMRESASITTMTLGVSSAGSRTLHDFRANVSEHQVGITGSSADAGHAGPLPVEYFTPPSIPPEQAWLSVSIFPGLSGRLFAGDSQRVRQRQFQMLDTWTFVRGRQEWRLGIDYRRIDTDSVPDPYRYLFRFANITAFMQGRPASVVRDYLTPARTRADTFAAFAQMTRRIGDGLSVDFGVRYSIKPAPASRTDTHPLLVDAVSLPELRPLPSGTPIFPLSFTDLGPRFAVIYRRKALFDQELTLRTAISTVFDERSGPAMAVFGNGYPYSAPRFYREPFPTPSDAAPYVRPPFGAPDSLGNVYAAPLTYRSPRTYEWELGLEQFLGHGQRLSATYVGTAGRSLPYWTMQYLPGSLNHRIHMYSSEGVSDYNGLLVSYLRSAARGPQWAVAYAWSHAIDLDSGEGTESSPPTQYLQPRSNRGSADFDRRHVLRVTTSYRLSGLPNWLRPLNGLGIDMVGHLTSGAAVTVLTETDIGFGPYLLRPDVVPGVPVWIEDATSPTGRRINAAAFTQPESRPGNLGRNTLRGSPLRQLDLALSRSWRPAGRGITITARCDAFNVLNVPNFGPPESTLGTPMFGLPFQTHADALGTGTLTAGGLMPLQQTGGPRSVQFGLRVAW